MASKAPVLYAFLGLAAGILLLGLAGCRHQEERDEDPTAAPIVVVTMNALPAHLVGSLGGEKGWTPNLDALAAEVWSARVIAPSSSPIPSMASLMTGVDAWTHQLVSHRSKGLRADLSTLPALLGKGWSTEAYFPLVHGFQHYGLLDGFDSVEDFPEMRRLEDRLRNLSARSFIWIHLPDPGFPWVDRSLDLPRLGPRRGSFDKVERRWLMPFADPDLEIPEPLLSEAKELYRHQAAWADERFGRLIAALRQNSMWPSVRLAVTAVHGNEIGEHGQVLFAQNLHRSSLEVPLVVKLGIGETPLAAHPFASVARLPATVIEMAGLRPSPVMAPSLFDAPGGAMSSLYDHSGVNRLSLVRSTGRGRAVQLLWHKHYAAAEPEMWAAQAIEAGLGSQRITGSPRKILSRLNAAFQDVAPLLGKNGERAEVQLLQWAENGGVEELDDSAQEQRMVGQLLRNWELFQSADRTPREEVQYWSRAR